jgi:O-antigen ligase
LAFLGLLLISFFFTHNIPLSLESLGFYLFSFLVFICALSIRFKDFKKEDLSLFAIFIGFVFSLLSLFFLLNQDLASSLPAMNLLYATYGHNHLAVLLLLVLPLGWREIFLAENQKDRTGYLLKLVGVLFITFTLLISFGRTALLLGLLQMFFIWIFYFRANLKTAGFSVSKSVFPVVLLLLVLILGLKMYFSYLVTVDENYSCPFPSWAIGKICKPLNEELRPLYFSQAVSALYDYPLTGYGPGTFQLINKKYQPLPHASTAYTHNHFLQIGSEIGVLGGVAFVALIGTLYWQAGRLAFSKSPVKGKSFSFDQALFIGAVALLVNAFFDFDWSFLGIFSLTIFFLGLILRGQKTTLKTTINLPIELLAKLSAWFLFLLGLVFTLSEILTRTGNTRLAFEIFPYFKEHFKVFEADRNELSAEQNLQFLAIYQYQPSAYFFYEEQLEEKPLLQAQESLFAVDPWRLLYTGNIERFLENGNYQAADQNLTRLIEVVEEAEQRFNYYLGFSKKFALVEQRLAVADYYFGAGDPQKTASYYLWAQSVDPWILSRRLPPVTDQTPVVDLERFLLATADGDQKLWGDNFYTLVSWHLRVFEDAVRRGEREKIKFWFELTDQKFDHLGFRLWEIGSTNLSNSLANNLKTSSLVEAQQQLSAWFVLWQVYDRGSGEKAFDEHEKALAESLVDFGKLMLAVDTSLADEQKQAFQTGINGTADLVEKLQWAADGYLSLDQPQLAEWSLLLLAQHEKELYWSAAQLGHFYVYLYSQSTDQELKAKWHEQALAAYDTCLTAFNGEHYDCTHGKQDLIAGRPNADRYHQVSQIIRGERQWQDF